MSTFQIIIVAIFGIFILIGMVLFAVFRGAGAAPAELLVWGTVPAREFSAAASAAESADKSLRFTYREIQDESFDGELVEALAEGGGPDLVLMNADRLFRHRGKLLVVSREAFAERDFRDAFIDAADIYAAAEGYFGVPFSVDPLVLYWNRSLFADAGVAAPPRTWEELLTLPEKLTMKDRAGNIVQSAVAFGEFRNVSHAKEILASLFLQAGSPVTRISEGGIVGALGQEASAVVGFFTEFSNPVKPVYSWNRSLPDSQSRFLGGDLALYIAPAGELFELRAKNPNLNFDVAPLPQPATASRKLVGASLSGISVLRSARDVGASLRALRALTGRAAVESFSAESRLPPVRRDLLAERPSDAYRSVFREAALQAAVWRDPDPAGTAAVFARMIESVTSGRARIPEAVSQANAEITALSR